MRPTTFALLLVICQIPLSQESSGACLVSGGEDEVSHAFSTVVGNGNRAEEALLERAKSNGGIVQFSEQGGYGILRTGKLDAFASKVLNLAPEAAPKRVAPVFRADDFETHPLDDLHAVPETWSPVIGSLILLLLLMRRRA